MLTTAKQGPIDVDAEGLDRVLALYDEGLTLQAYELARTFGPIEAWAGTRARILAGRLAMNLGAPKLSKWLQDRAWRDDREDPEACFYQAIGRLGRHGPLRAWGFLRRVGPLDGAPDAPRADWLATHAIVLGHLRDFDAAEAWLAKAERARPECPWIQIQRSHLLELQDRYEEALAAARHALDLRPWYRPAVQATAQLLQVLDRDREALDLLLEADGRIENGPVVTQLAALQGELGLRADARRSYERFAELSPLMEDEVRKWLEGRRSDAAYECGDLGEAIAHARESGLPFFLALADRLERAGPEPSRVELDVPFVRQHHQTCAPATLAALGRFWGMPADHLEVADAICYDGTPDHRERSWAEQSGWAAREFTVTWEAAVALLDRGVPFTLTTVDTLSAHLQAVIGYDARRRTLLIRDPNRPHSGEVFADGLLEQLRSVGPRGMAMVPRDRQDLLDGVDLPEATHYDHVYRMQLALREHDRDRAAGAYAALEAEAPGHRLTLLARRLLAGYDGDVSEILAAVEGLLGLFPEDTNLRLAQLGCLRELSRRDERLALLGEICERPDADPIFHRQLAQELLPDAREHPAAVRLARRALRRRPLDETCLSILASVAWDANRLEEALELRRFAACLDDKDEGLARSYFAAARHLRREEETLRMLEGRFRRFGRRSSQPARTLCWAYTQLERRAEAFELLDEALRLRPDEGELLLFVADAYGSRGDFDRADGHLAAAEGRCRRSAWLRSAADLASARGDLAGALGLWRRVLEVEPAAMDAHAAAARLLAETEGRAAALGHLAAACDRFPHNFALHQARIDWLREDGPAAEEPAVRRILEINPADAWARRELALVLGALGRHEEALAELALARELEPSSSVEASVRGQVLERLGRRGEAMEAYREALRRSVDNDFAMARLIEACDTRAERREAVAFIAEELRNQVIFGDGLLAFARHAGGAIEPDELLASLREAWESRPDLWHGWSALVRVHVERGEAEQALDLARRAVERFPLLPRLRLDLAAACEAAGDPDGEREALGQALRISPGWGLAARQLSAMLERDGRYDESRAVLEQAVAQAPLDAFNHGFLADALWHLGEQEPALERITLALRLDPGYDWGWDMLRAWSRELGRPGAAADLARELTAGRGGEARTWLRMARELTDPELLEERLDAVERALALDPQLIDAHDLKAELLAGDGRFDEASAACRAPALGDRTPFTLRGRLAWVEARRGDLRGAIALMKSVVDERPDYYWGLKHLAEWSCDAGSPAEYLEAAEAMVRLAPDDPVARAYRGEARLKSGDRPGAREDFGRAVELAPLYTFAAMTLFDLELADGDVEAAGRTLDSLKGHLPEDEFVLAREVQLAARRSDREAASGALRRLCAAAVDPEADWPFRAADEAFARAGWGRRAEAIFEEALDREGCHPVVAALWVERRAARRDWSRPKRLDDLLARGEVGLRVLTAYLHVLGRGQQPSRLASCLRRDRAVLREATPCWGAAGYALTTVRRHRDAADWMADWEDRDDAQPWMLINLALALRALGRVDEARRVSARALGLPGDYTSRYHATWLALDEAIDGDDDEAADAGLAPLDPSSFDATHRYLYRLAALLARLRRAGPGDRRQALAEATRELKALGRAEAIPPEDHGAVLDTYRRAVRRMAAEGGDPGPLWRLGRWLGPPRRAR